jgi:phosphatidylserine decarboxylase
MVMVGAMIVAAMQAVWHSAPYKAGTTIQESFDQYRVEQGHEAGRFLLGSTVILITDKPTDWRVCSGEKLKIGENLEH